MKGEIVRSREDARVDRSLEGLGPTTNTFSSLSFYLFVLEERLASF